MNAILCFYRSANAAFSCYCIEAASKGLLILALTLPFQHFLHAQVFTIADQAIPGTVAGEVAWGDFNNDGFLDFIITGEHIPWFCISSVFQNHGDGTFSDIDAGLTGVTLSSVDWGDFDNDNDLDLLITGQTSGMYYITKIYRNDGNGQFTDIQANLPGISCGAARWGDYDNDGQLDVILTGNFDWFNDVTWLFRNDNGIFTLVNTDFPGYWFSDIAWCDYDNDGDLDFVLIGRKSEENFAHIFRNDGNGVFTDILAGLPGVGNGSVSWGDYDQDGRPDLLISGYNGSGSNTIVFRNDGNDVFTNIENDFLLLGSESVRWGDYDNDGDLDISLPGNANAIGYNFKIYRNEGGVFIDDTGGSLLTFGDTVEWGDFDNDGDLDLLVSGWEFWDGPTAVILRNDGNFVPNTPPIPPESLNAEVTDNAVMLHWEKSTDSQTQSDGLTYNVRIGSSPGGTDIVSPMSCLLTGKRLLPRVGNAWYSPFRIIRDLAPGTYYWSVQAVDNNFDGSLFSVEESFVIVAQQADEIEKNRLVVFPNPADDYITIKHDIFRKYGVEVLIQDCYGRKVFHQAFTPQQAQITINTSSLKPALYFIELYFDGQRHEWIKFIVSR